MNFTKFPNIDFVALRNELKPETPAMFGNMNAQQMIEHVSLIYDYVLSNNKINVLTPDDKIEKVKRAFLWSEGGFKRGITNEFTKSISFECKLEDLTIAINEFEKRHLLVAIAINQNAIIDKTHPVFGLLNTEEWTQFFTKHTWHHFNQFGLIK